jgi:molybdopterin-guanine dinucleotide biosynthesis protein A
VHAVLPDLGARIVEGDELLPFGGEEIFLNVNTPPELAQAESILRRTSA